MDQQRDRLEDAAARQPQQAQSAVVAGHEIRPGMTVVADDGGFIGVVEAIEGDEMRMAPDADGVHRLLPLSLVAGAADNRVIMRGRGDNAFGMEA